MYISLLVIGLVMAAGGLVTIGFGIPINAFSLGNTLIVAGTVGLTGGMVLIGLAAAVRQLRRIAESMQAGAALARAARPVDLPAEPGFAPPVRPAAMTPPPLAAAQPPMPPTPPRPLPPRGREPARDPMPRPPEPRLGDFPQQEPRFGDARPGDLSGPADPRFQASSPASPRPPLDWLRPRGSAPVVEPPVVELADEAPLSPQRVSSLATMAEPLQEPKAWAPRPEEAIVTASPVQDPKMSVRVEPRTDIPAAPDLDSNPAPKIGPVSPEPVSAETDDRPKLFDAVWPTSRRGASKPSAPAPEGAAPSVDARRDITTVGKGDTMPKPETAPEVSATAPMAPSVPTKDDRSADTPKAEIADKPVVMKTGHMPDSAATETSADATDRKPAVTLDLARDRVRPVSAPPTERSPAHLASAFRARLDAGLLPSERPVAVLKSGMIDGMAYTLYADGSIEADLSQGKMRFSSVDALRAHLEKNG